MTIQKRAGAVSGDPGSNIRVPAVGKNHTALQKAYGATEAEEEYSVQKNPHQGIKNPAQKHLQEQPHQTIQNPKKKYITKQAQGIKNPVHVKALFLNQAQDLIKKQQKT